MPEGIDIFTFLPLLSGLGLFLYGMHVMGGSLEKLAGAKLERTLDRLTSSPLRGVLLGTAVTAVIQSSSATTVMVVGFVNAGIMKLAQAVTVIMGANIGTTVTSQILRLSDIDSGSFIMRLLKPSGFSHLFLIFGAVLMLFAVKKKKQNIGGLFLGLGMLFFGMLTMESALTPLRELDGFKQAFASFSNPLLGILIGAGVTAVLQSSSASIGILQALSTTGAVTFGSMIPIVLGQNIGTCITVILASIGANRNAKRAAAVHLCFNVIGTVVFTALIYGVRLFVDLPFWAQQVNMGDIANFHTVFNLVNTLWMLPFAGLLVKIAEFLVRDDPKSAEYGSLLDDRFLATPAVALEQCRRQLAQMGVFVQENVRIATALQSEYDLKARARLDENEEYCDHTESSLTNYLIKVSQTDLSENDHRDATLMIPTLTDYERISDRAVNIAEVAEYNATNGITFSGAGQQELAIIAGAVDEILTITLDAYQNMDMERALHIEPLEEVIDDLTETLRGRHVTRLQSGVCTTNAGISFIEILGNIERIADHCSNIGIRILQSEDNTIREVDRHEYLRQLHEKGNSAYNSYFSQYRAKYIEAARRIGEETPAQQQ